MAEIIDFTAYRQQEHAEETLPENTRLSEELIHAIQTLIHQLRTAPLSQISLQN